jgi:hypothetical protein
MASWDGCTARTTPSLALGRRKVGQAQMPLLQRRHIEASCLAGAGGNVGELSHTRSCLAVGGMSGNFPKRAGGGLRASVGELSPRVAPPRMLSRLGVPVELPVDGAHQHPGPAAPATA